MANFFSAIDNYMTGPRRRLLDLQLSEAEAQVARENERRAAIRNLLSGNFDAAPAGYDESTGIDWNQPRPENTAAKRNLLNQIDPEAALARERAAMYPTTEYKNIDGMGIWAFPSNGEPRQFRAPDTFKPTNMQKPGTDKIIHAATHEEFQTARDMGYVPTGNSVPGAKEAKEPLGLGQQYAQEVGGTVPAGMRPQRTQTGWQLVPLEGGPLDPRVIAANAEVERDAAIPDAVSKFTSAIAPFNRASELLAQIKDDPNTEDVVGGIEGSEWYPNTIGDDNASAWARIKNLQDLTQNIGLEQLRSAGVAPGSVTEKEWPKFAARVANLATRQGESDFLAEVKRLETDINSYIAKLRGNFTKKFGIDPMADTEPAQGAGGGDADYEYVPGKGLVSLR